MKKKNDTSLQQFSHALNVRKHRTKKDAAVIDGILMIEAGCRIRGKKSFRQGEHPPINFRLETSEEDLRRLLSYACNSDSDFSGQFSLILADALQKAQVGARGKFKGHETDLYWIKEEASFLHTLYSIINDSKIKPDYFNDFVEEIPPDEQATCRRVDRIGRDKGYDPVILTAYRLEKFYGAEKLTAMGLKPFYSGTDSYESFYITYIQPGRKKSEAFFDAILNPILLRLSGVTYLCKKGQLHSYVFTTALARRLDMVPCDKNGNEIQAPPIGKNNPHYQEALAELFEQIRSETLFRLMF